MTNCDTGGQRPRFQFAPDDHYMGPSSSAATLKGCCCCLFLLFIFLSLLSLAVALVIILAVRPRKPEFNLQRVGVEYLLVAPEDSGMAGQSAAYLSLNITLLFTAVNPNKMEIKYEPANLYVLYRGVPLGTAVVQGFEQSAHSTRLVDSRVSVSRFNVLQADAVELVRDATVNDRVELRVTADVGAKIRMLGLNSPRVQVSVDCAIAISPRKQLLAYKKCGVDGLNI